MKLNKMIKGLGIGLCLASASMVSQADTSGQTVHPIVLVHGLSGFDRALVDYFYGIKPALASVGASEVYTPQITGYESNEHRNEELLAYLEELQAVTGAEKFNLIGHSQGGTNSRYVASVRPDLVASVTSVATPHFGSEAADSIKDSMIEGTTIVLGNLVGDILATISGDTEQTSNTLASLASLNIPGAQTFNSQHPQALRQGECKETPTVNTGSWWWPNYVKDYSVNDGEHSVNGIKYYSWSGTYSSMINSATDPVDALFAFTSMLMSEESDGLVGRCSSHMGKVIRDDYTLNHGDEINQMFGLRGFFTSNPVTPYVEQARRLKSAGL